MKKEGSILRDLLMTLGTLGATLLLCLLLQRLGSMEALVSMVLVLAVFLVSVVTDGYVWGVLASLASVLIDNFVFAFPYFAFDFLTPENLISALVMLVVAIMTSTLTTKIKTQEKRWAEAQAEKTRANLLRAVSHDLRTPLTTIYGSCSAIMENYDSLTKVQQLKLLGEIQEDSENLIRMVENLLSVTRIGGSVRLVKTPTVLEELIDTSLVKFRKLYPGQRVEVSIPEEFISIPMDALLIQQVLINLLENAVLHAAGMEHLWLAVTVRGNQAVFEVADDGCGIPKDRLSNLFAGYLESMSTNSDSGRTGMGIGLNVCASIINAHGGRIEGKNRPSGGAVFRFWLEREESGDEQQQI